MTDKLYKIKPLEWEECKTLGPMRITAYGIGVVYFQIIQLTGGALLQIFDGKMMITEKSLGSLNAAKEDASNYYMMCFQGRLQEVTQDDQG